MKNLIFPIVITFLVIMTNSCRLTDDRESKVREFLSERITSESQGALKLETFTKTNGYEQDGMGMKMYVLGWQADILTQKEIWKGGNPLEGYWQSFGVMSKKPGFWDSYIAGGSTKHFGIDAKIRLTGESNLMKTEQGWRVEGLSVKTSQILSTGSNSNSQSTSTPPEKKVPFNQSDANARQILLGKWYGTIGKKNFSLSLETIGGGQISGYNIAGKNQRPISGSYSFYNDGRICSMELKEPGDDKWDGTFKIEMEVYSDDWAGTGTWKAYSGQLSNPVSISRRPPDNPNDFITPTNSSNDGDKFIGVWVNSNNDQVKISKSGKIYKVAYQPDEDEIFDFEAPYKNGTIKCPFGQDNRDTIVFSLVGNQLKFVGDWNGSYPGPETYLFNKK
jgi:hypothetical protein